MKNLKKYRVLLYAFAFIFMVACNAKQSADTEEANEESAIENAASEAVEEANEAVGEVGDAIENAADEAADAVSSAEGGETSNVYTDEAGNTIYKFVEQMPAFVGGESERNKYLSKNLKYPETAKDAGNEGRVIVEFIVNEDGTIGETKVVKALEDESLNEEALRVVSEMPAWEPGKQNGENVKVAFTLPIQFKLN